MADISAGTLVWRGKTTFRGAGHGFNATFTMLQSSNGFHVKIEEFATLPESANRRSRHGRGERTLLDEHQNCLSRDVLRGRVMIRTRAMLSATAVAPVFWTQKSRTGARRPDFLVICTPPTSVERVARGNRFNA